MPIIDVNEHKIQEKEQAVARIMEQVPAAITNAIQYESALEWLKAVKDRIREVTEFRDSVIKPMNEALTTARDRFKKILDPLGAARDRIERAVVAFREAEAERVRKLQEVENKKAEKAALKAVTAGKDVTDIEPPRLVESAVQNVQDTGVGFEKYRYWWLENDPTVNGAMEKYPRITADDPRAKDVPQLALTVDFGCISRLVRAGAEVPGIKWVWKERSRSVK